MSVERGEIKRKKLLLYELSEDDIIAKHKIGRWVIAWAPKNYKKEKKKELNKVETHLQSCSIGMVATSFRYIQ